MTAKLLGDGEGSALQAGNLRGGVHAGGGGMEVKNENSVPGREGICLSPTCEHAWCGRGD